MADDADGLPDIFAEEAEDDEDSASWAPVPSLAPPVVMQAGRVAIWGSALRMARWLSANVEVCAGKRVVELGGGSCLPALVAAKVGAASVVGTDLDAHAVAALERAIERNGLAGVVAAQRLDWFDYLPAPPADALAAAPVVLAADVNYFTAAVPALLATVGAVLSPGGVLVLASREERIGLSETIERLQQPPLRLRLCSVATFDEDGARWATRDAAADDDGAGAAEEAPHRLWVLRRPEAGAASFHEAPFHEAQSLMHCARHALNNLLRREAVSSAELDEIALSVGGRWSLAHRWPLLGNHDANVLLLAMQRCGLEGEWWDARRPESELVAALGAAASGSASRRLVGVVLNVRRRFLGIVPGRHWVALRRHGDLWEDADSALGAPMLLGGAHELAARAARAVREEAAHLIVVREAPA